MSFLNTLSHFVRKRIWKNSQYLAVTLLLSIAAPVTGGQTPGKTDTKQMQTDTTLIESTPETEDDAWIKVNEEPREMSGIVIGAIIVNLTLIVIFFRLLFREWHKNRTKNNLKPISQTKK